MSLPDAPHANSPGLAANAADITAAIVAAPGAEPRLGSIALPPRTPGTTLVTVVAAPVNPLDLLIASGTFHSARHEAPYVPGSECVGVVFDSVRFPFGSSVYGECRPSPARSGAFATQVLINDENLLSLPAGVDPVQAAAVGNSGTAAYLPSIEIAGLQLGEMAPIPTCTTKLITAGVFTAEDSGAGGERPWPGTTSPASDGKPTGWRRFWPTRSTTGLRTALVGRSSCASYKESTKGGRLRIDIQPYSPSGVPARAYDERYHLGAMNTGYTGPDH